MVVREESGPATFPWRSRHCNQETDRNIPESHQSISLADDPCLRRRVLRLLVDRDRTLLSRKAQSAESEKHNNGGSDDDFDTGPEPEMGDDNQEEGRSLLSLDASIEYDQSEHRQLVRQREQSSTLRSEQSTSSFGQKGTLCCPSSPSRARILTSSRGGGGRGSDGSTRPLSMELSGGDNLQANLQRALHGRQRWHEQAQGEGYGSWGTGRDVRNVRG
ncbi:unnamed protein product, partial [Choristocarpus tenellus]